MSPNVFQAQPVILSDQLSFPWGTSSLLNCSNCYCAEFLIRNVQLLSFSCFLSKWMDVWESFISLFHRQEGYKMTHLRWACCELAMSLQLTPWAYCDLFVRSTQWVHHAVVAVSSLRVGLMWAPCVSSLWSYNDASLWAHCEYGVSSHLHWAFCAINASHII